MKNGGKQSNDNQTRGPRIGSISPKQRKNAVDSDAHVVFDFTGLHTPAVSDLALVLTARLQTPPSESVWAREIHPRTAEILRALRLDHMFPRHPDPDHLH
ncbi:MAG: hypothetical protein VYD37_05155 [Gemmatimonadota bacterium]|nr:hypothetical protein [Gemmatimonadota bacterium]